MMEPPKRCFTITFVIGGDTWEDAIRLLYEFAKEVERHGPECKMVSGGYSAGGHITIEHRPEMTHDKYEEVLEAYRAERETRK